jgi:hypothetical protein
VISGRCRASLRIVSIVSPGPVAASNRARPTASRGSVERLAEIAHEILVPAGLRQELCARVPLALPNDGTLGVGRYEQCLRPPSQQHHPVGQLLAGHPAGYHHVGEQGSTASPPSGICRTTPTLPSPRSTRLKSAAHKRKPSGTKTTGDEGAGCRSYPPPRRPDARARHEGSRRALPRQAHALYETRSPFFSNN